MGSGFLQRFFKSPLLSQFFWRNERISISRVKSIVGKVRANGGKWLWGRLRLELRTPETIEGVYLRNINVRLYSALLFLLSPINLMFRPWLKGNRNTLFYFYDLDVSPITFDIADYLVLAELERRRRGLERLYVYIVPGRGNGLRKEPVDYEKVLGHSNLLWRLYNLVIPMFSLLPSCVGYSICQDRRHATWCRILAGKNVFPRTYWPIFPLCLFPRSILEAARRGVKIFPMFFSSEQSLTYVQQWLNARTGKKKIVTITMRSYRFEPARNSNIEAWVLFAKSLNNQEFIPIFLFDTETAMDQVPEPLQEFLVFHEGPWNLALRSALYELAYLNMAVVHGPTELLWYNECCRYLVFFPEEKVNQTQKPYVENNGFIPGESLPFATPFQKWIWESDELSTITREFHWMCQKIEGSSV